MRYLLWVLLLIPNLVFCAIPENAKLYIPELKEQIKVIWPDHPLSSSIAAQIEQETCVSLKSKMCWNPRSELKTSREYGFGLGQITIAFDAQGKERFNNFNEFKKLDRNLSSWKWEDRYNPSMQLLALVRVDKNEYTKQRFPIATNYDRLGFSYSSYNGGFGGILQDRKLCEATQGCDPTRWFDNVEKVSFKQKTKIAGYGQSFFDINRSYVKNVLIVRRLKYKQIMEN